MIEFQGWPKTPRLFRDMIVTEKIDGTNSAVIIEEAQGDLNIALENVPAGAKAVVTTGTGAPDFEGSSVFFVAAQSRKRLITPGKTTDNHGFAQWVHENAAHLVDILAPGRHFGEWWGSGIQRGYGLRNGDKRFSLFNVNRYAEVLKPAEDIFRTRALMPELDTVPILYRGPFTNLSVKATLIDLRLTGSHAAPGFMNPEGVVVFHEAAGQVFKATLENDEAPKGLMAA